jgi:hypothetical protein
MHLQQLLLIGLLGFCLYPLCSTATSSQRLHATLALGVMLSGALLYSPAIYQAIAFSNLSFLLVALSCLPKQLNIITELKKTPKLLVYIVLGTALTLISHLYARAETLLPVSIAQAGILFTILNHYKDQPSASLRWRKHFVVPYCFTSCSISLLTHQIIVATDFLTFTQIMFGVLLSACVGLMMINAAQQRKLYKQLDKMPAVEPGAMQIAYKSRRILKDFRHDLRQPLSTLGILASVGKAISKDPEVSARYMHIQTAQKALKNMLEEFFEGLENSIQYPFKDSIAPMKAVNLGSILEPLVEEYRLLAQAKQLQLRYFECEKTVFTNTEALTKILRNGLDNAIKYTEQGGVLIGVRQRAGLLCIQITDTGPGIDTDPNNQSNKGWGYGSTIVQELSSQILAKTECRNRLIHNKVRGSIFEVCLLTHNTGSTALFEHKEHSTELGANVLLFGQDSIDPIKHLFPETSFDRVDYNTTNLHDCLKQALQHPKGPYPVYLAYTESQLEMELAKTCLQLIQNLMGNRPCCILIHPATDASSRQRIEFTERVIRLPYKPGQPDMAFKALRDLFPPRTHINRPSSGMYASRTNDDAKTAADSPSKEVLH